MPADFVIHPITGEHRRNDGGTARLRNRSIAFREAEERQLAGSPTCECGQPATEAHVAGGICTIDPPYDELESLCRNCHDATICTAPRVTAIDRLSRWW